MRSSSSRPAFGAFGPGGGSNYRTLGSAQILKGSLKYFREPLRMLGNLSETHVSVP